MKIILKSCTIVSPNHTVDKPQDILIENGTIEAIADRIDTEVDHVIERKNLHVSAGWFDARVGFRDPGDEVKEDLFSGLKAAEAGGMTAVAVLPNTEPPVSNKAQIEYIKLKGAFSPVDVYPYGTLTEKGKGENLSEMYDMQQAGAVAFTDGSHAVSGGIMYRALLYAKNFNGKIVSFPWNEEVFGHGYVHEGKLSVMTGLKAIPSMAEFMVIERDLNLLRYTEGELHFSGLSTKESVELIRKAKAEGLAVTADVYVHNLVYNEDHVLGFDSEYKVLPPLRAEDDRQALIAGVKDGTIDFVCSDHAPEDIEHKEVEFDQAAFGMIGVQTLFPLLNTIQELTLSEKINAIGTKPRRVLGLNTPEIAVGGAANLTLFDPEQVVTFESADLLSKSKNTPIIGQPLKGMVYGIINEGLLSIKE